MNTLHWVCSRSWPSRPSNTQPPQASISSTTSDSPTTPPSFDEIATHFQTLRYELFEARRHAQQAALDLRTARETMSMTTTHVNNQRVQLRQLQTLVSNLKKDRSDHQIRANAQAAQINDLQKKLKVEMSVNAGLRSQINNSASSVAGLRQHHTHLMQTNQSLAAKYLGLEKQHQEALFELEYLKCVEGKETDLTKMPLVPQPFVVVLVDGDAYSWAPSLFQQKDNHNPGAFAATQIRRSVEEFIAVRQEISPNAKIIVRVFVNESGKPIRGRNLSQHVKTSMSLFMRQFTEALPLFDFFDSGQGKERADFKIKENFQLYLSNPHCHHIFLATCTDNGFARMLEPYRYHAVRDKITLVSPGFVCREIDALGFNTTQWPEVFSRKQQPPEVRAIEAKRSERIALEHAHNLRMGFVGTQVPWISALVKDVVTQGELWITRVNQMIFRQSRNIGVKRPLRIVSATTLTTKPPIHFELRQEDDMVD